MRVPPALMWWEVRTVSTVPATLDTQGMESPVWVSTVLLYSCMAVHVVSGAYQPPKASNSAL